ncbi:SDR family oxidoreductase [Nakamurella aerolata]|uniref:SDR family oxidoreductase n=1 Tax=Nakamurella aerolata TaxID=1656892 RepID=A0A849A4M7_9ACTN|nr:SDR family oxidoreductase [Nakamurella aerolata]NNG35017.1 SDR family oxidoreductase [Nakamurella aerolata]
MTDTQRSPGPFDLAGRTALVTGSSRGIGAALALALADAGATVVVHGRDAERAAAAAARIADGAGRQTFTETFDVTDAEQVDAGIGRIVETVGPLDILVNNAGLQRRAPITEFTDDDWNDLLATNVTSAFLLSRRVARDWIADTWRQPQRKIINIGSVQSRLGRAGIAPYSATKGAIAMLTRGLAADLAPHNIGVNALAPGYFATELTSALVADAEFSAWVAKRTPAGRWGELSDLAGPVVFLAAPASDFVQGQVLFVDGGMTAVV